MASFCYLPVDDNTIALRSIGAGDPVVLLHSSASSSRQWRRIAAVLAESHRVLMPDFAGCGDSAPWSGRRARTLATDAAIVGAVAEHVGAAVHLVGHSYGGAVALAAACRKHAAVRSLVVIEPVAFSLLEDGADRESIVAIRALAGAIWRGLMTGDHAAAMAQFIDYWNGAGTWQRTDGERQGALIDAIGGIGQEFSATLSAPMDLDDLAAIDLPSTVISGLLSPRPTRHVAELVAASLPLARHHVLAGAGHMLPLSHPEETAAILLAHLAGTTAADHPFMPHAHAA